MIAEEHASLLYQKGVTAKAAGDFNVAYQFFIEAINLNPKVSAYFLNLALVSSEIAKKAEPFKEQAMQYAQQAAKMSPEIFGNWIGLGEIALNCDKFHEAIAAFEQAMSMDANHAAAHGLCGFAYAKTNRAEKAIQLYEKAVQIDPEMGVFHFLLSCQYAADNFNPAKQAHHGELGFTTSKPARLSIESCWNSAHGFLGIGDYEKGWKYFECRHNPSTLFGAELRAVQRFEKPMWKGESNCTVRIHAEMGLGDAFLFARFLPIAERKNIEIIFECQQSMLELMAFNFPTIKCIAYGAEGHGDFDYHLPMMSLPHVLQCHTASWSNRYLFADPQRENEWRSVLSLSPNKPNIGICWSAGKRSWNAGNTETYHRKSVPFEQIEKILKVQGVNFISLQVDGAEQFPNNGIKDFSDTAAIINLLDVVITIDSAVANLAGAMGKTVWLMDRFDHCWRWRTNDWFPTAVVFRQKKPNEWGDVVNQIKDAISVLRGTMSNRR